MAGGVDLALRFGPPDSIKALIARKIPGNPHHNLCVLRAISRAGGHPKSRKTSQITKRCCSGTRNPGGPSAGSFIGGKTSSRFRSTGAS